MIRSATIQDCDAIQALLTQLGYANTASFLGERIETLLTHPDAMLFVYEKERKVLALLSLHIIPQIALLGAFLRISYFVVDESARNLRIGSELEAYATQIAKENNCDRIEVHCHSRRIDAHRFYERQGYLQSPRYYVKEIQND